MNRALIARQRAGAADKDDLELRPPRRGGPKRRGEASEPETTSQDAVPSTKALDDLVRYIPTEVITLYLAALGLVGTASEKYTGRWIAFATFAALTPIAVWVDWLIKRRRLKRSPELRFSWFNPCAATLAFVAWAFALPGTPFGDLSWYDAKWGGFVALVVSVVLGKVSALVEEVNDA